MNPPSFRRKWTAGVVVGGLLASAIASSPVWAQQDPEDINDEIESTSEDLNATIEEYNGLATEIADNKEMIEEVETDLADSEEQLADLRERLADFITETYVDQGVGDAALILESGSPQAFVERMDRLNSANMYDFDLMEELRTVAEDYTAQLELLEDLQADLEADQAELEEKKTEIETRMEDLEEEWRTAAGEEVLDYDLPRMSNDAWAVVDFALDQVGKNYVWGTSGPDTYDCSGLVLRAYAQIGISLPHNAAAQYSQTAKITRDELQPGDLVFYNSLGHMGMYIGNGLVVHAPNSNTVVKVVSVDHGNVYYGATTILY
ncbi:C40 family peptidase [Glycomyces xiaoerkulensis]|uniref:C40 family peptidase n=1 Tax=Glycomyces xiaoerkulensis TaxID=2038139 RepID=UPI000C268F97|nr:C40 family peptidase [Glycomyces xiaoerkulensis]